MKRGGVSRGVTCWPLVPGVGSHLSMASLVAEDQVWWENSSVVHLRLGSSGDQRATWDLRSERFSLGEHVPDGFGEGAGELDAGDLGATLSTQPGFGALVVVAVAVVTGSVNGGLDQRPAQVLRPVAGEAAAPVAAAG